MGIDMHKLQLPSLVIPGLFLSEKIVLNAKESRALSHSRQSSFNTAQQQQKNGQLQTQVTSTARERSVSDLGPPPGLPHPLLTPPSSDTEHTDSDNESQRGGSSTPPPPPYRDPRSPSPTQETQDFRRPKPDVVADTNLGKEITRSASASASAHSNNTVTPPSSLPLHATAATAPRVVLGNASGPVSYRPQTHTNLSAQARRFTQSSTDYYPSQYDNQTENINNDNSNANGYKIMTTTKQRRINREIVS